MKRRKTKFAAILMALVMVLALFPLSAMAEDPMQNVQKYDESAGYMIGDLLIMRPLGIVATAVGSVMYVVSLPFSLAGGNEREAYQKLIQEPAQYTFQRPLGEM